MPKWTPEQEAAWEQYEMDAQSYDEQWGELANAYIMEGLSCGEAHFNASARLGPPPEMPFDPRDLDDPKPLAEIGEDDIPY